MPLDPALWAYAGLAACALSTSRVRRELAAWRLPSGRAAKAAGALLLAAAAWSAVIHFGPSQGVVAWFGLTSLAGVALILALSASPRVAVASAGLTLPIGLALLLVTRL